MRRHREGFDWLEFWMGASFFVFVVFWLLDKYKVI